ncbi:hypothetical protein RGAI101_696 [Roseobacter sp. GAI101]|nr:hypothetical protein RGAI101_696 [Roseobacter sp. GAI101]
MNRILMIGQTALAAVIFGQGPTGLHMHRAWAAAPFSHP